MLLDLYLLFKNIFLLMNMLKRNVLSGENMVDHYGQDCKRCVYGYNSNIILLHEYVNGKEIWKDISRKI